MEETYVDKITRIRDYVEQRMQQIDELGSEFDKELITFRKRNSVFDHTCGVIFRSIRNAKRLAKGEPPTA